MLPPSAQTKVQTKVQCKGFLHVDMIYSSDHCVDAHPAPRTFAMQMSANNGDAPTLARLHGTLIFKAAFLLSLLLHKLAPSLFPSTSYLLDALFDARVPFTKVGNQPIDVLLFKYAYAR